MVRFITWRVLWLVVVALLVSIDQLVKGFFSQAIPLGAAIPVTDFFNLVHLLNKGAAFSMFADQSGWQRYFLICVALLVVLPVTWMSMLARTPRVERWVGAFLVAGGVGNLVDRMSTGAVVDYLDFYWRNWHWPAFNLADVFVVGAALAWILLSWRQTSQAPEAAKNLP